nr:hypothetical protein [uncultured Methanobacterium sp.]
MCFALLIGVVFFLSVGAVSATNSTSYTPSEIANASVAVQNQIDTNEKLPDNVTIGNQTVNTAQYLHLAAQATDQIQNNNKTPITLQNDKVPGYSEESLNTGTMTQTDYEDFARRLNEYINNNHQAPPYGYIGQGKIGYQSQVYLFSRILSIYNSNGTLPATITVKAWNTQNIPITEPTTATVTIQQILTAAQTVKNYIETNKALPNTITIGTTTLNMAQFLYLTTTATTLLNNGKPTTTTINVAEYTLPNTSTEQLTTGTLNTASYTDLANRISQYIQDNKQAPTYGIIGLGKISYQSQIYLYTRILTQYKNNGTLPATITVKAWNTQNIPITEPTTATVTIAQILTAAQTIQTQIETNKALPNTITIGTTTLNMAQFLYLTTTATTLLNNGKPTTTTINVAEYTLPNTSTEQLTTGTLNTASYTDLANRISQYIQDNKQAPTYGIIGLGKISYQSQIYLYTRILTQYKNNGTLPATITVKAWNTQNIPITEPTTATVTIAQILTAAQTIQTQIETNKALPNTITIGTTTLNMAQFLYLTTTATTLLNNGKPTTTTINVAEYTLPNTSTEQLTTGTLNTASYTDLANRISQYIQDNKQAPTYGIIGLGKISYQSQIYLYTRILTQYKNNGTLPATITVKAWNTQNIPITEPTTATVTIAQILTAAQTIQTQIETNKALPNTITIGTTTLNMAQFLYLTTTATTLLNNGKPTTTTINVAEYTLPNTSTEQLTTGTLNTASYTDLANRISQYIQDNKQAPTYGIIGLGKISYQSQIYLYTRILTQYKNNGTLPSFVTVKSWSNVNIPIVETPIITFTPSEIVAAATALKNTIESTKTMPNSILIGGKTVSIAQFLHMAVQATVQLNNNNNDAILFVASDVAPGSSTEDLVSGVLFKDEYIDLAARINSFMTDNHQAPSYGLVGLGKIGYQSQVYLYCRILSSYNTNHKLPDIEMVKGWSSSNIPLMETPPSSFTLTEILAAANTVEAYLDTYKHLPTVAEIAGVPVNMAQYLHLLTMATVQLKNNNNASIALQKDTLPSYSSEQLSSGNIGISEYVDFAQRIAGHMNDNHQAPPYGLIGLGKISYQSQIYLFNQILSSYYSSNTLPSTATVKSLCKPVWITSDRISSAIESDYNRLNAIVSLLRSWGVDANVFGVGPDTQNAVLRASYVQQNALVVDLYGGACAGTIYAMTGSYYQGIKGGREIYSIWTTEAGGWDITNLPTKAMNGGVNFLPRAHDDTFSTYLPDRGYNYYGVPTDGLNNPDQFMINHGFNFMVCGGDIMQMASAIFNEART